MLFALIPGHWEAKTLYRSRFGVLAALEMVACGGRVDLGTDPATTGGSAGGSGVGGSAMHGGSAGTGGAGGTGASGSAGFAGKGGVAGSGGIAGSAGTPCNCGPLEQCWNSELCVPKLIDVPGGYSIDATEVTRSQYEAWLASDPKVSGQPLYCIWNTDYGPDADCTKFQYDKCEGSACAALPQACVDWCDARAYCAAVGKRLCGGVGGGQADFLKYDDPTKSQWFDVCSSHGTKAFPYGDAYEAETCRSGEQPGGCPQDPNQCFSAPVGSLPGCQATGSYAGVYDLSGNVYEWEDSCEHYEGPADSCRVRGGSYFDGSGPERCDSGSGAPRQSYRAINGLRCCSP